MPRSPRADEAGGLYHALNRANLGAKIFRKTGDFVAFEKVLHEALQLYKVELYAYQIMGTHWHLMLRPLVDGEMGRFCKWICGTHTMRHNAHYHMTGKGHLYQGRFKSFPIQSLNPSCCPHGQYRVFRIGLIESMNHLLTVNSKQFATVPNAEHHSGMKAGSNPSRDDWILNQPCDLAGDRECDLYRSTIKRKRFDPIDFPRNRRRLPILPTVETRCCEMSLIVIVQLQGPLSSVNRRERIRYFNSSRISINLSVIGPTNTSLSRVLFAEFSGSGFRVRSVCQTRPKFSTNSFILEVLDCCQIGILESNP